MFVLPDAELEVTRLLGPVLPVSVFVGNRVPNPRRDRMVVVRRDGGRTPDVARDIARCAVQVWDVREDRVAELANDVRAHLRDLVGVGAIRRVVEQSGPVRVPDESGAARVHMVYEFTLRGA